MPQPTSTQKPRVAVISIAVRWLSTSEHASGTWTLLLESSHGPSIRKNRNRNGRQAQRTFCTARLKHG